MCYLQKRFADRQAFLDACRQIGVFHQPRQAFCLHSVIGLPVCFVRIDDKHLSHQRRPHIIHGGVVKLLLLAVKRDGGGFPACSNQCKHSAEIIATVFGIRTHLNAARMSAAGNGSTEPHIDLIESLIRADKL